MTKQQSPTRRFSYLRHLGFVIDSDFWFRHSSFDRACLRNTDLGAHSLSPRTGRGSQSGINFRGFSIVSFAIASSPARSIALRSPFIRIAIDCGLCVSLPSMK